MAPADPARRGAPPPEPEALDRPERLAVFLDVDGTLLTFRDRPEEVRLHAALRATLERLARHLEGAVALISGRTLADLDRIFDPLSLPAAGLHGLERRDAAGARADGPRGGALDHLRAELHALAEGRPGVFVEDKGRALALHYRGAPREGPELVARVRALAAGEGESLSVLDGKMVVEVKPCDADKGSAIEAFLAEPPFAGRHPVFLGDDATDEDGFRAVNARAGLSVRVDGPGGAARDSAARYRLPDETAVEAWLDRLDRRLDARGADRERGDRNGGPAGE